MSACAPARSPSRSAPRARCSPRASGPSRTRPEPSPASPTPPVGILPLVCTLNAALVTEAIGRLLAVDHSGLDDLALAAPSGSGGLVLVPYLAGERTPNRPDATGTLQGIRSDVSRELLARAAFEGVVCSLLEGLDALDAAGRAHRRRPAGPAGRRGPFAGLPPGAGHPVRPTGHRPAPTARSSRPGPPSRPPSWPPDPIPTAWPTPGARAGRGHGPGAGRRPRPRRSGAGSPRPGADRASGRTPAATGSVAAGRIGSLVGQAQPDRPIDPPESKESPR